MRDELDHIKNEYIFEDDIKGKEKIESIITKINEINFTKKRLQFLRRVWADYKKNHKDWQKLINQVFQFLSEKVETPTEMIDEFDEKKLKLICVDYIS
jgi:Txe/YoeB family toxin of Txe-Axe toxin-antitoxin module